jgi:hypothetical protein
LVVKVSKPALYHGRFRASLPATAGGFAWAVKPFFYFYLIFIEIVGEREYPFYGNVVFLAIILREEQ